MPATEQQKAAIVSLVKEGKLDFKQIAKQVGVTPGTVASVKAHITMGSYGEDPEIEQIAEAIDATFGLERDLQLALHKSIDQLEPGLKIADDGKEQIVETGRIDIIAEDASGTTVVIELKAGPADRETIGQILGYMGDMMITKPSVRGCRRISSRSDRGRTCRSQPTIEEIQFQIFFRIGRTNAASKGWSVFIVL